MKKVITGNLLFLQSLLLCLVFTLNINIYVKGQTSIPPRFSNAIIVHFNDEDGLMSNDITGITEDVNGFLWIATQFGIARFDGKYFKVYTQTNTPSLSSNRIAFLSTDLNGTVFLADANNTISFITPDEKIKLWPGARLGKDFLFGLHGSFFDISTYLKNKADSTRIQNELKIRGLAITNLQFYPLGKDSAYFISNIDVSYFDKGRFTRLKKISDRLTEKSFFTNGALFVVDYNGTTWGYYKGKNIQIEKSFADLFFEKYGRSKFDIAKANFCSNKTGAFLQYGDSVYAIAFEGNHLVMKLVLNNLGLPWASDIYYSALNRLFVFRSPTGFFIVKNNPFTIRRLNSNGVYENNFKAAVELRDGTVLTSSGILFSDKTEKRMFAKGYFNEKAIFKDNNYKFWYVHADSIYCTDDKMQVINKWLEPYPDPVAFTQDMQGAIWHASTQKLMKIEHGHLTTEYSNPEGVVTEYIFPIHDSCLWIGTTRGLFSYNYRSKKVTEEPGLRNKDIRIIYRAKDGTIWLGTYGQGFYCYRNGKFYQLPLDKEGFLSSTHCFMEDEKGFFWISTNKGLFQVIKKDLDAFVENKTQTVYYYYYDKTDGLVTNEFNGGSTPVGIRLSDGTFSFPSLDGLVWIKPTEMNSILPDRSIYIDDIRVGDRQIENKSDLEFEPKASQISFHISSPFFGNGANQTMEYRIKNNNETWTAVLPDNTIFISYLPAGEYTLEIRKQAGFGVNNYKTLTKQFSVRPHFYETLFFKIIVILKLAAGLYLLYKRRVKYLNQREQKLESLVHKRTEELNKSISDLEKAVADLKISEETLHRNNLLKDKLTSIVLHDLRSPVRFVNLLVNQLYQAISSGNFKQCEPLAIELKRASTDLSQFTQDFLAWLMSQQSGFKTKKEYVSIQEIFNETEEFFTNMLQWKNNKFIIELKGNISSWTDKQLLKIVLHNLVDNANKHTENGTILLEANHQNGELVLRIEDSGSGMTPEQLKILQHRLQNSANLYLTEDPGSLGYTIIKDFVNKLNGQITVNSTHHKGTSVVIIIPDTAF
jgi:signal transduction histidine kinase